MWLESNNIEHEQEKRFDGCKTITNSNQRLPFDFYIIKANLIIEYDGRGHFQPIRINGIGRKSTETSYQRTMRNDKIKNKYCIDNNIELLRIPYTEYKNIKSILSSLLLSETNNS